MTDPQTQNIPNSSGSQEIVRQMKQKIADATQLLRTQSEVLKQRGITMLPTLQDQLRNVKSHSESLEKAVATTSNELVSLRALARTTALINSAKSTSDVLNQVIDTVIELTKAERGYIVLTNAAGELDFTVSRGITVEEFRDDGNRGRIVSTSVVRRVAQTGEPVLTDNASSDANLSGVSIVNLGLRSILAVPLRLRDQVIGVVYCDNRFMTALFKPSDLELLTAFGAQAAVAIENARLFESTQERLGEIIAIRDRMDNIFTSISSGIITLNRVQQVIVCNAAAEQIIGRDLIGENLVDVLPEMGNLFYATLEDVLTQGRDRTVDCQPMTDNGKRLWNFNVSPLLDDSGGILGLALVLDDLTEQKARQSQLEEVQRYLPAGLVNKTRDLDTGAQEREITAIFADVRGFTAFSERLQPQELMTVINKYLSLASDAINLVDGVVDKYMGDAVTGFFNTQLNPQEDHAVRAVQAAVQLVSDQRALHEVIPDDERIFFGIGIHTGMAVLGIVGGKSRKEFGALGEAPDIAKYMQEQAGKGEIIISEDTYQLVRHQYECEEVHEVQRAKAGYEHVRFYRVLKRKKGSTSSFIDRELLDLLGDLNIGN